MFSRIAGASAFVVAVLFLSKVQAQENTSPARSILLEQITVTANKREQELGRIDGGVSVRTAEELRQSEVKNVSDLERVFPGLVIRSRGNRAYSNFTVRGMSSPDFYNPSVQVYVDGVPQS